MNPILGGDVIGGPGALVSAGGPLDGLVFLALVGLLVAFVLVVDRTRGLVRMRLYCPQRFALAHVVFRTTPEGARRDVTACSLFRGRTPTCDEACVRAPFVP
jgi:hypothetical protein